MVESLPSKQVVEGSSPFSRSRYEIGGFPKGNPLDFSTSSVVENFPSPDYLTGQGNLITQGSQTNHMVVTHF